MCTIGGMSNVYKVSFGEFPVRFVRVGSEVYVSRNDLYAALVDCFVLHAKDMTVEMLDGGLSLLGDSQDKRAVVLGQSEIGPAIHFHAVGNLLDSLSSLTDVDSDALRESSFRTHAVFKWYVATMPAVDSFFGRTFSDTLDSVRTRLDRLLPALIVNVTHGEGMFTAECDALHLVTEAATFEELTAKVWELAPEMIEANDLDIPEDSLRLQFEYAESFSQHRIAL